MKHLHLITLIGLAALAAAGCSQPFHQPDPNKKSVAVPPKKPGAESVLPDKNSWTGSATDRISFEYAQDGNK
jgi:hypothetical protein